MRKWRLFACLAAALLLFCACTSADAVAYADEEHEHIFGFWYEAAELTCEQAGEQVRYCKLCHHAQEKTTPIPEDEAERAHDFADTVVPPAGDEPGFISRTCERCGYTVREPLGD